MRFASAELIASHRNGSQPISDSEKVGTGEVNWFWNTNNQPVEAMQQSAFRRPIKEEEEGEREVRLLFFRPPTLKLWRFL